mmetsp:Transcript_9517/g.27819  ORF Transcript_9517/g.27819 Transcript_9517/m.27819 type:complete len:211 (-) Transcript_9517:3-635(-)
MLRWFHTRHPLSAPSQLTFGAWEDVRCWALTVTSLFLGMLASSMVAMQCASLGALVVFRNIVPVPTMRIKVLLRTPLIISSETVIALAVIIFGMCIYESRDLTFSVAAVAVVSVNMAFAVIERLRTRELMPSSPVELSTPMMMILNSGVSALPCVALTCLWGELKVVWLVPSVPWRVGAFTVAATRMGRQLRACHASAGHSPAVSFGSAQ